MFIAHRPAASRGSTDLGWLKSRHTFSFGEYYDPHWQSFGALRVINDDWVSPGAGFPTHGHRSMEIITLVLEGAVEHKDSLGTRSVLPQGHIQVMSAGSGIRHSEYNASQEQPVHFLQIWIEPRAPHSAPQYAEANASAAALLVSPSGAGGVLSIGQDATITRLQGSIDFSLAPQAGRGIWLHCIAGEVQLPSSTLKAGDSAGVSLQPVLSGVPTVETADATLSIQGKGDILLFDVPCSE